MSMLHARPHTISLPIRPRQRLTHSSHFELLVINSRHNFPFLSKHSVYYIADFTLNWNIPVRIWSMLVRLQEMISKVLQKWCHRSPFLLKDAWTWGRSGRKGTCTVWMNTPRVILRISIIFLSLNLSGHSALNSLINRMLLSAFTGWVLFSYCFLEPKRKLILCPGAHKPRFETDSGEERLFVVCLYTNLM